MVKLSKSLKVVNEKQLEPFLTAIDTETTERWQGLIELGKFEEEKAALSLLHSEVDLLALKPRSLPEAMEAESPTLATVKKYHEEYAMRGVLQYLLYDLRDYFNVGGNLTEKQIEMISEFIFEDFYYLKISEIVFVFRSKMKAHAKKGSNKLYNRLDGEIIFQWLTDYSQERAEFARDVSVAHAEQSKKADFVSKSVIKKFRELLERRAEAERIEKEKLKPRVTYRSLLSACLQNGINYEEASKRLEQLWRNEYQSDFRNEATPFEAFCAFRASEFLYHLNQWEELSTQDLIFLKDEDIEI